MENTDNIVCIILKNRITGVAFPGHDFSAVRDALEKEGIPMAEAEVTMVPQTWATLTNEDDIKKMNRILDLLDEDDDVQNVYHNWDE